MVSEFSIFEQNESAVRSYCRKFPAMFVRAKNSNIWDSQGNKYLDFVAGAGALNYGHNPPALKELLLEYIKADGISHSMDMYTTAKRNFVETFECDVLRPRGLNYKFQFVGPTGSNAVEAALKVARKFTQRTNVVAFTNGFHGMSLGAMAATGSRMKRGGAGCLLTGIYRHPYDGYLGAVNTAELLERMLEDGSSGLDLPAAIILETVQGEGGLNSASTEWLQTICGIAKKHGIVTIFDDIQAGCGRTGRFFSFEGMDVKPDVVCLSKSLSAYGLPLSIILINPEMDIQAPGEHSGTFRGFNLAFVTATGAVKKYWSNPGFQNEIEKKAVFVRRMVESKQLELGYKVKGRGLFLGLEWANTEIAKNVSKTCFNHGLLVETAGGQGEVLKLMPPLTTSFDELQQGVETIFSSINLAINHGGGQ